MLLVDSNVLFDLFTEDPVWGDWSKSQLRAQSRIHKLAINPVIYAEVSVAFESPADFDERLGELDITLLEIPRPALFLAARAHVAYRRQGGVRAKILADFFIGAHAETTEMPVLTRDGERYRSYFPRVSVVSPPRH